MKLSIIFTALYSALVLARPMSNDINAIQARSAPDRDEDIVYPDTGLYAESGKRSAPDRDEDIVYPDTGLYAESGKRSAPDRDEDIVYPDTGLYAEGG